jgi:hypothetical protein
MMLAVHVLRPQKKVEQRLTIDDGNFLPRPIHTHGSQL